MTHFRYNVDSPRGMTWKSACSCLNIVLKLPCMSNTAVWLIALSMQVKSLALSGRRKVKPNSLVAIYFLRPPSNSIFTMNHPKSSPHLHPQDHSRLSRCVAFSEAMQELQSHGAEMVQHLALDTIFVTGHRLGVLEDYAP